MDTSTDNIEIGISSTLIGIQRLRDTVPMCQHVVVYNIDREIETRDKEMRD